MSYADTLLLHNETADSAVAISLHPDRGDASMAELLADGRSEVRDTTARWIAAGDDSVSMARMDSIVTSVPFDPVGRLDGLRPAPLRVLPGQSSVILAILLALFVGAGCNPSGFRRTLVHYRSELWSVRRRRNAFDEDTAGGLAVMRMFLTVGAIIVCGVCASLCAGAMSTFSILAGVALAGAFYIFEYCAYWLTGYAFSFKDTRKRWLSGFSASVALTGLWLFIPALFLLFFPEWTVVLAPVSVVVFLGFRCVFITKGFRIFFEGFPSLLYFILYLCTLEIIPLMALLKLYPFITGIDL
ncbi:MAG: DUF4271 domain-containing protein [Muribaculaceae bacterium]|nr:DUF4271 domain-containing protein [Muribaculaceae bacterium]